VSGHQSRLEFLAVRARYIREMRAAGTSWDDMLHAINLTDPEHARQIADQNAATFMAVDPIAPDEIELERKRQFGAEFAAAINEACCPVHGSATANWHVGVVMRRPITERDRFFVLLAIEGVNGWEFGPMSADIANELLTFAESGIAAGLPGADRGHVHREIRDLTIPEVVS
jgi:hypothetical protein